MLVEGSELVGDVLDAFVLEPAGYAVEGAVAVAGCVVVLHVGLNGFIELGGGFLCVGGLAVLFFLLAFFCCDIIGFPVEEAVVLWWSIPRVMGVFVGRITRKRSEVTESCQRYTSLR